MQNDKLLPCPFCGGEAKLYGNSKLIGTKFKHYQVVVCTDDDCRCRTCPCETVEDAIYKWNTRKPMEWIVERLEDQRIERDGLMSIGHNVAMNIAIAIVKEVTDNAE